MDSQVRRWHFRVFQCLCCVSLSVSRYCCRFPSMVCELRNWAFGCPVVLFHFGISFTCHGFWLLDGPVLPLLLPEKTCNIVFLASWAYACRASCRFAHLVPEVSEHSRVSIPTDHWSMPLLRHPNFRLTVLSTWCPRCTFHALDEATVPDFLIILRSNRPCCVNTLCCSDNVLIALCGSSKPNTWNESGIEFSAFGFLVSDFRINS